MVRKVSRRVWIPKVEGLLGAGIRRSDSVGDMAVAEADKRPYLSTPRYLESVRYMCYNQGEDGSTDRP